MSEDNKKEIELRESIDSFEVPDENAEVLTRRQFFTNTKQNVTSDCSLLIESN